MSLENKYDDPVFFEKYSQMDRSREGLSGAGEWQTLRSILPEFAGKRVLDLGCGYGWHCMYAAEQGAASVLGLDLSEKMLAEARRKTSQPQVEYRRCAMEEAEFPSGSFEVVLSSLALHYVKDYPALVRKVREWLAPGGDFVFTCEHPVFTAQGPQDWEYDREGNIRHFPVDRYFVEGERDACFLGEHVVKYHRTLTTLLETLLENGFALLHVKEPQPPAEMLSRPGWADELRRPMMLAVAARRL